MVKFTEIAGVVIGVIAFIVELTTHDNSLVVQILWVAFIVLLYALKVRIEEVRRYEDDRILDAIKNMPRAPLDKTS